MIDKDWLIRHLSNLRVNLSSDEMKGTRYRCGKDRDVDGKAGGQAPRAVDVKRGGYLEINMEDKRYIAEDLEVLVP